VIVTALVVAGLAWQRARAPAAPTAPAAPVASAPASVEFAPGDLAVMQPGRMVRSVPLTGTLRPVNQTVVRTKVAGDLREAPVREGMPVKRGQTVARIDPTEYEVRVRERDAQRLAAEAQLEQAKRTLDNTRQLHERGFVSQSALDQVLSAREVAAGNRDAAIAQLALARKALADTVLTAPIDGVVAERFAQPGEKLPVDGRVLSIVDLSRMEIEAPVPAAEVGGVLIGQAVELRIEGVAQRQTGRVVRIAPTTQPGTRSVPVYIALDNRDPSVRAGLFAQGSLAVESRDGVLALPAAAIRDAGARLFVYAIDDGRLVERDIRLGMRDDASGTVEVREGLRTGERVVVANLGALRAGSLVKVAEPGAAAAPAPAR
jgi:RND family efflux transporter MFP subunit